MFYAVFAWDLELELAINSVQQRSRTDSISNQTAILKQRPGRDQKPSTRQKTLEGTSVTGWESCRSVTDEELVRGMPISKSRKLGLRILGLCVLSNPNSWAPHNPYVGLLDKDISDHLGSCSIVSSKYLIVNNDRGSIEGRLWESETVSLWLSLDIKQSTNHSTNREDCQPRENSLHQTKTLF